MQTGIHDLNADFKASHTNKYRTKVVYPRFCIRVVEIEHVFNEGPPFFFSTKVITSAELAKHNSESTQCWVALYGKVATPPSRPTTLLRSCACRDGNRIASWCLLEDVVM